MKRKPNSIRLSAGFTLVELLVVIVIIGVLAALAMTMTGKMRKRGEVAKSVMNMRQISSAVGLYMADNSNNLPVGRVDVQDSSGSWKAGDTHWHQALLALTYPNLDSALLGDRKWWDAEKPFVRNPLANANSKPNRFEPWWPGYAINLQISSNLFGTWDWAPGAGGPQSRSVNLSMIPDPSKTPLVAPRGDWHYSANDLLEAGIKGFLVDGKLPILFVDGHIESMTPNDYVLPRPKGRDLGNVPPKKQ